MDILKNIILLLIISTSILYSQNGRIIGKVINKKTGGAIKAVNIILSNEQIGTTTNNYGEFEIKSVPPKSYKVIASHIGFKPEEKTITLSPNTVAELIFELEPVVVKLGEVKVTSTKYIKLEKDVSIPLEVVPFEEIERRFSFTPADVLKNEPGVSIERDGIWATTVNIRGLSRDNIVTLIDGNRIETANNLSAGLSLIDLNDLDRIEVIKGSASSLYGTGALGGTVNLITKELSFNEGFGFNGSISSSYNSVNNGYAGNVLLKASSDFWYAKLNATSRKADNIETPIGELENSQFQDNNISGLLGFKIFDNQELKLSYQRYYAKDVGIPGGNTLFPSNADVRYPFEERNLFSGEYIIKNIFPSLPKISLKYFNQNIYRDVENIPHIINNVPAKNGEPAKRIFVDKILPDARHYINGIQFQSNWIIGKSHFAVAGIDAWKRDLDSRRERHLTVEVLDSAGNTINTINQVVGERPLPEADYTSFGFYVQDEFRILPDKLSLTIGGRIDRISVSNLAVSNPVYLIVNGTRNDNPPSQSVNWNAREEEDISWSGNLSFLYSVSDDVDLTFTAARSFRSPTLEERYQFIDLGNLVRIGDPDLNPEHGYFFDAGIKVWNPSVSFGGNVFINLLNDLVVETPGTFDNRSALITTNVGEAQLYGFDLGFEINSYNDFVLYGNAAYVRGKDTENDKDLPQIPPLNGKIGLRSPMFEFIRFDISSTVFTEQSNVAEGEIITPGYVYFDLFVSSRSFSLGLTNLKVFAGIENIFDKAYRNHLSTNRGFITVEPGRNIFARISVSW